MSARVAVALLLDDVDRAALEAWLATIPNLARWEIHDDPAAIFAEDDDPSEAELLRYYHHGGEDTVARQQIRDAGRPGI